MSDAEVGAAAGDLVYAYYVHDLPPKHKHQDFTQQGVERLISPMFEIGRGHVKKEPSKPDSQTTSQPLHTTTARRWERAQRADVAGAAPGRTSTSGSDFTEWECRKGNIKKKSLQPDFQSTIRPLHTKTYTGLTGVPVFASHSSTCFL
ncbi:unnamed protein product [Schistocephalus solidus]|uniref:Uncharacterized protein n=1 Tax=Schistocephalus solidus TaxID=70667 RepID=A0A3P7CM43_SCHSO|nr:unnamed protein product [Schistocephalus solidus]